MNIQFKRIILRCYDYFGVYLCVLQSETNKNILTFQYIGVQEVYNIRRVLTTFGIDVEVVYEKASKY